MGRRVSLTKASCHRAAPHSGRMPGHCTDETPGDDHWAGKISCVVHPVQVALHTETVASPMLPLPVRCEFLHFIYTTFNCTLPISYMLSLFRWLIDLFIDYFTHSCISSFIYSVSDSVIQSPSQFIYLLFSTLHGMTLLHSDLKSTYIISIIMDSCRGPLNLAKKKELDFEKDIFLLVL